MGADLLDAVVVGAGLSGLCAARRLRRAGLRVQVVEARDRVGGRTLTAPVGPARLDLGGQWVGPGQDRILGLLRELGIGTFPTFETGEKLLDLSGRLRSYTGAIPRLGPLALLEMELILRRTQSMVAQTPAERFWAAPEAAARDRQTVGEWARRHVRSAEVRLALAAAVRVIFGADPDELSLLHFLAYCNAGGGFLPLCEIRNGAQQDRIIGGAQPISERLAAELGLDLLLSRPLRAVEQDEAGLTLRCDGLVLRARRAILALPPAMAARVHYSPALPAPRDQLMQRMPMGATIKVFALYERPFWREQGRSGEVVAGGDPITVCFDNTTIDGQAGLVGFIVGSDARRWGARPEAERRAACLAQLERWFGPEARRPHTWAEKDWATEPWSRGCPIGIAGPTVLSEHGEWLRRPVGRLHWAGTETATRWMGFLDGAVQAGERAADEVQAAA